MLIEFLYAIVLIGMIFLLLVMKNFILSYKLQKQKNIKKKVTFVKQRKVRNEKHIIFQTSDRSGVDMEKMGCYTQPHRKENHVPNKNAD